MSSTINNYESFPVSFLMLSEMEKRIFVHIQRRCRELCLNLITQEQIAEDVKCSRKTVNRAISLFNRNGWIEMEKRSYRSSIYRMADCLLNFDVNDQKNFMNKSCRNEE